MRQRLARRAEQHLLVRDQPGEPHRVHRHAVDTARRGRRPAPPSVASGAGPRPRLRARGGDQLGGAHRGAARRVRLVRVVQLDDLDRLEVPRRQLGEPHRQHRADGEVRRDEHADPGRLVEPARARWRASPRRSRWCRPRSGCRASMQQRMLSSTASGWVKSTTTSAPASATLNSQSPASTIATSSRSSAASTARQTSPPIRPRAPSTPTRTGSPALGGASRSRSPARSGRRAVSADPVGPRWVMPAP